MSSFYGVLLNIAAGHTFKHKNMKWVLCGKYVGDSEQISEGDPGQLGFEYGGILWTGGEAGPGLIAQKHEMGPL